VETFEDAHQDLAAVVDGFVWTLGPAAEAALRAFERQPALPRSIDGTSALSPDQEATILLALGQDAKTELVRSAVMNRQQAALRDGVDPRAEAILSEKAHSVIYKAVAQSGSRASISAKDREALAAQFKPDTIGFIERELAYHASQELDMSWSLGPPRSFFRGEVPDAWYRPDAQRGPSRSSRVPSSLRRSSRSQNRAMRLPRCRPSCVIWRSPSRSSPRHLRSPLPAITWGPRETRRR